MLVVTIALTGKQYILHRIEFIGTNLVQVSYGEGDNQDVQQTRAPHPLTLDDEIAVAAALPAVAQSSLLLEVQEQGSLPNSVTKDLLVLGAS